MAPMVMRDKGSGARGQGAIALPAIDASTQLLLNSILNPPLHAETALRYGEIDVRHIEVKADLSDLAGRLGAASQAGPPIFLVQGRRH
ncbi:hypothetical protein HTT03_16840 [Sulfitobacter sp. S0837]|uniref:hypothetical protein n=1 Tax=Sulfitobacter maritimus TaxID=2741719 RepID=UPI0015837312|nr:hypothetical protein [Sulfitobacter maritimus]NUH66953.1 hypothetical protein [Sulfitobacter maritimus]